MALSRIVCFDGLKCLLILLLFLAGCSGGDGGPAGSATLLSWAAPYGREDNVTRITLNEIAGYNIYYRSAKGNYRDQMPIYIDDSNNVANIRVRLDDIPVRSGTYSVVVTTIDIDGRESVFSAPEVAVTF